MPHRSSVMVPPLWEDETPPPRLCDHPGCNALGEFPAPKSPDKLRDYYWFCLDHVRAYNKAWNFFKNMSEAEVEAYTRRATVWERDTYRPDLARFSQAQDAIRAQVWRDFGMGEAASGQYGADAGSDRRPPEDEDAVATAELAALRELGLAPGVDFPAVKSRYRDLVKRHHPDANGGCKKAEDKLKTINAAFHILKVAFAEQSVA